MLTGLTASVETKAFEIVRLAPNVRLIGYKQCVTSIVYLSSNTYTCRVKLDFVRMDADEISANFLGDYSAETFIFEHVTSWSHHSGINCNRFLKFG